MGFLFGQPKIQGDERQKCLNYLEEELKISAFHEKESQLLENVMLECSLKGMHGKELQERISSASTRLAKAAEQIVKRRAKLGNIPDTALATYSAWNRMYSACSVWITEQAAQEMKHAKVLMPSTSKEETERMLELFQEYQKYKLEAAKEHHKLLKRLKLSDEETQELLNNAAASIAQENWQPSKSEKT
jgi:hypothetical protein